MATSNKPQMSLDSAFSLLTSMMRDPKNANACAPRISVAAGRIDQELEACPTIAEKIKFAKSHPDFLRAGIKFLTFPQSPVSHVAMVDGLALCQCDFRRAGIRNLHKLGQYRPDGQLGSQVDAPTLFFDAVSTVSTCLTLALTNLTQHRFREAGSKSSKQSWPAGPEDLLPYGPKDSLIGLELWVAKPPLGYTIFKLASSLILLYVPFAQEVLRSPYFAFPLVWPFQHIEKAVKFYNEGDSSSPARTYFFSNPIKTVLDFFEALKECESESQFNPMIVAQRHWISPILASLTTILSGLPMEWSEARSQIQFLTALANAYVDPVTGSWMAKFERSSMTELSSFDPIKLAFEAMLSVRKTGCLNSSCSSTTEVVHSRLCSGCNLIRYCSQECQKQAWKPPTLPHKDFCKKIRSLKESLGTDDWAVLWTPDVTYGQFRDMCTAKKVDTELVQEIGRTIYALRMHRYRFQEDVRRAGESQVDRLRRAERQAVRRAWVEDIKHQLGPESVTVINRDSNLASVMGLPGAAGREDATVEEKLAEEVD